MTRTEAHKKGYDIAMSSLRAAFPGKEDHHLTTCAGSIAIKIMITFGDTTEEHTWDDDGEKCIKCGDSCYNAPAQFCTPKASYLAARKPPSDKKDN